jgi:hypothetical protein
MHARTHVYAYICLYRTLPVVSAKVRKRVTMRLQVPEYVKELEKLQDEVGTFPNSIAMRYGRIA